MQARQSVTSWRVTAPAGNSAKSSTSFFAGLALVVCFAGLAVVAVAGLTLAAFALPAAFADFAAAFFDLAEGFAAGGFDPEADLAADAFGLAADFFAAFVGLASFAVAPVFLVAAAFADFFAAPAFAFVAAIVKVRSKEIDGRVSVRSNRDERGRGLFVRVADGGVEFGLNVAGGGAQVFEVEERRV